MKTIYSLLVVICCLTASGCAGTDTVVVDDAEWIQDGAAMSWKLEPGTYKVELTANNDGAAVEWVGASCTGTAETTSYSGICELSTTGQVIVTNPSILNAGLATSVTVKITKLARTAS